MPRAIETTAWRARAPGIADRVILGAVVLLVSWGTLAFGAVYPWAYVPLFGAAAVTGTVAFWRARSVQLSRPTRVMLVALTITGFGAAAQAIPLPYGLRIAISPASESFLREVDVPYSAAAMLYESRTSVGGAERPLRPLSLNPRSTMRGVAMLAALTLLLGGLTKLFGRFGAASLVSWIIAIGTLLAVIGIVQKAMLGDHAFAGMRIYGFWEPRYKVTTPFGPYVNKNHYAGWMIMALPLAIGYLLSMAALWRRHVGSGWRDRLLWLSSPEGGRAQLVAFAIVLMGLALTLTMSRSGLLALVLALLFSLLIGARRQYPLGVRLVLSAGLLMLLAGGAVWSNVDIAGRFTSGSRSIELRREAWRDALAIVRDFPLVGTGLNTYATATLKYDTTRSDLQFHEAHNEYLQLAAEGGLWLGLPVLVAILASIRAVRERLQADAPEPAAYWLRFGASVGLLAIALQSFVEFSLQMPGNAALFVVVASIALHPRPPRQTIGLESAAPV